MQALTLRVVLAAAAVGAAGPGGSLAAQIAIRGAVVDPAAGRPARGVRVEIAPGLVAWTNDSGRFALTAAPGRYTVRLHCPRHDAAPLEGRGPTFEAGESARLDLEMPGGAACLPALSATEYGEFDGLYLARPGGGGWFRLCGDTTYRIAASFSAAAWTAVNGLAHGRPDALDGLVPRIAVRGALAGPGIFGVSGDADYQLGIEQVSRTRLSPGGRCD